MKNILSFFKINSSNKERNSIWKEVSTENNFQSILQRSRDKPQVIYKHSPSCSISFIAKQGLNATAEELSKVVDLHIVDVIYQRDISHKIAEELRIRHESPQILLIEDGKAVWSGSHWQVSAENILNYFKKEVY